MSVSHINHYWHDRKHVMSLPIGEVSYSLSDRYIDITEGLFRQCSYSIPLHRIVSIRCRCGLRQRLVNQGDIIIEWIDDCRKISVIENIKAPLTVRDIFLELSEQCKLYYCRNRHRGYQMLPAEDHEFFFRQLPSDVP